MRARARPGVHNCGLVIAVVGEKLHDLGVYLSEEFDMSLPMDPDECLHTPEGQAYHEEQARRAYQARLAAMEEMQEITYPASLLL